jgi:hypothetical protein
MLAPLAALAAALPLLAAVGCGGLGRCDRALFASTPDPACPIPEYLQEQPDSGADALADADADADEADAEADAEVDAHANDDGGVVGLAFVCGEDGGAQCPTGFSAEEAINSPSSCGSVGCKAPVQGFVCVSQTFGIVRFNCDLTTCLGGGFVLVESYPSCDCAGGTLYVCVP